ncbi:hypothetical protein SAMN05660330_00081 [Desulforhopalus singaporensis]|uniref:Uncharacterized protein n=1 Tax=Desulforhopalus singaporensis TaxID=91360 RepID=A0A1H0IYN4_9BACT|nr:hypothetical protein SAMN05660330_00081 [Desulforhopalus singaporensis]
MPTARERLSPPCCDKTLQQLCHLQEILYILEKIDKNDTNGSSGHHFTGQTGQMWPIYSHAAKIYWYFNDINKDIVGAVYFSLYLLTLLCNVRRLIPRSLAVRPMCHLF